MEISEFTLRLLLLFFPGIVCAYLVDALTVHRPKQPIFFLLQSFVLGLSSYFTFWTVCSVLHRFFPDKFTTNVVILRALVDKTVSISFWEVGLVTVAAIIIGLLISVFSKYKVLYRVTHLLRLTRKFGELDVWGFAMNLKEVHWVTLRDHRKDLIYDGWVQAFSDDSQNAEMLLRDVTVYKNDSGEYLYQTGALYVSRNRDDITFECRTIPVDETVRREEEDDDKEQRQTNSEDLQDCNQRGNGEKGRRQCETDDSTATPS